MRQSQRRPRAAFTLVELLVVVAVIALLIGILLPALGAARESARGIKCLSNVRQLALATNSYAIDGKGITPAASYNNNSGISPKARQAPPGTPITSGSYAGMQVWDSIGSLLYSYLGEAERKEVYQCPSAFRTSDNGYQISGKDPYSGMAPDDIFRPNYFYMSTALWINLAPSDYWYPQVWATRNIANVKISSLPMSDSKAVAWVDESTSHHTGSTDIYDRNRDGLLVTKDVSNFGYLDGHAEAKSFNNLRDYFEVLPPAIDQSQFGIRFRDTPAWHITNTFPN